MFGLEKDKSNKKNDTAFQFDLEKELKDQSKQNELLKHINDRVQKIKTILRTGEDKEVFEKLGILLYGYASLVKIIARLNAKK